MKRRKNQHEWGVIAQCKKPYREFHYCPLCRQYSEAGDKPYMTHKQFAALNRRLRAGNPMYYADSRELFVI